MVGGILMKGQTQIYDLFSMIRRYGITSGELSIHITSDGTGPTIWYDFYDEETNNDCLVETIDLENYGEFKEMDSNLPKTSEDAAKIKAIILNKLEALEPQLLQRAEEIAQELRDKTSIEVTVNKEIDDSFRISTEYERNMEHARAVLRGIDDDN